MPGLCCLVSRYLRDNSTRQNPAMVESTLQYYASALVETAGNNTVSTAFAGQNSTTNNSTLVQGITSYNQCSSGSSGSSGGGFFSRVGNAISNAVSSAACEVSSAVSAVEMEVDAAKGYLDDSAEETPGQINATFTNVDVSHMESHGPFAV